MSMDDPVLMIVDDEPLNLHVLERMLRKDGYNVLAFPRGDLALKALENVQPDLILLDIRMPGMDGYDVCRQIKGQSAHNDTPVIFLSALSETSDKVRAFEVGGVDYVAKPLSEPEVLARVRTHLSLRRHTRHLNELVQRRTEELSLAHHRLKIWDTAKTHWITMLAHELRTPLTGLFCVADILFTTAKPGPETNDLREDFNASCARIKKLIDDATMLATIDIAEDCHSTETVDLSVIAAAAQSQLRRQTEEIFYDFSRQDDAAIPISAASGLLRRAVVDLCQTAGCCVPSMSTVSLRTRRENSRALLEIATDGKPLPPDHLATFFDVGGQQSLMRGGADYGLAPALARQIIHLFDGTLKIENGTPKGIRITASFPIH